ncbi:MAG: hypothetical protein DMF56_09135 [Acidobacteria bacterium]|nr:MAG: hypothetical protein DMF56_09135 [Acidobacteriota bacterium]
MKRLPLFALALLVSLPLVAAPKSSVKIINGSKWDIHHLFVSAASENHWGKDQLGDNIIQAGESFTLNNIPCDDYDVKVVDEDGDECVVENVHLCSDHYWKLTDDELLNCEGYGDDDNNN